MKTRTFNPMLLILICISMGLSPLPFGMDVEGTHGGDSTRAPNDPLWNSLQIWGDVDAVYGAAIGDVDPYTEGNELVVGGESNRLTVISGHEKTWSARTVFVDDWYILSVEVGDLNLERPGDEIICAGYSTKVTLVERIGQAWESRVIWTSKDWIYNLAIADLDPGYQGNEILVVGDDRTLTMLVNDGGEWRNQTLWMDLDTLDALLVADVDPSANGSEILVSGASKRVTMFAWKNDTWNRTTIWSAKDQPISMASGDIVQDIPGNEIIVAGTGGGVILLWWDGSEWRNSTIWKDRKTLYSAKVGDFTQLHNGDEIAVCGWSGNLTVLWEDETALGCNSSGPSEECFKSTRIFEHSAYLLNIAIGEFDPYHTGEEMAVVAHNGWVLKCQQEPPGFDLFASPMAQKVPAGNDAVFWLNLISRGGFDEPVDLEVVNAPESWGAAFPIEPVIPTDQFSVSLSIPEDAPTGEYDVEIEATSGSVRRSVDLIVSVAPHESPDFYMEVIPSDQVTTADYPGQYSIRIEPRFGFDSRVNLSVSGLVNGMMAQFDDYSLRAYESTILEIKTSAITIPGTYHLQVTGISGDITRTVGISLEVLATGTRDFILSAWQRSVNIAENESVNVYINVQSIFGFDEEVTLQVVNLPAGIKAIFLPGKVRPTDNATLNLTGQAGVDIGSYEVIIRGEGGGMVHETVFILKIVTPYPKFTLQVSPPSCKVNTSDICTFYVIVIPQEGFSHPVFIQVSDLPPFSRSQISPDNILPGEAATVTIEVDGNTPVDVYNITVDGEGGGRSDTQSFILDVEKPQEDDGGDEQRPYLLIVAIGIVVIFVIMLGLAGIRYRRVSGEAEKEPDGPRREGEEQWKWSRREMDKDEDGRPVFKQGGEEEEGRVERRGREEKKVGEGGKGIVQAKEDTASEDRMKGKDEKRKEEAVK